MFHVCTSSLSFLYFFFLLFLFVVFLLFFLLLIVRCLASTFLSRESCQGSSVPGIWCVSLLLSYSLCVCGVWCRLLCVVHLLRRLPAATRQDILCKTTVWWLRVYSGLLHLPKDCWAPYSVNVGAPARR